MNAGNKLTGKSDGRTSEYKITFVGGSIIETRTFDRRIQETPLWVISVISFHRLPVQMSHAKDFFQTEFVWQSMWEGKWSVLRHMTN